MQYPEQIKTLNIDYLFSLKNTPISQKSFSDVLDITIDNQSFIVKRYYKPGKKLWLRLFAKRSKSHSEHNNLLFFAKHGIYTPEIVGLFRKQQRSCLVTKKLPNVYNLAEHFNIHNSKNNINNYNLDILIRFTKILRQLHDLKFVHRDYKLRNVLLSEDHKLYLIDCPNGISFNFGKFSFIFNFLYKKLALRDLVIAYKDLRKVINPRQLIYLYKIYYNLNKLDSQHKKHIKYLINHANRPRL
ncbi:MAG: hypothetical protein KBD64_00900 [Gammaproteobacteria bacterium]|nr:hypothetical protein [Gammaproteobacteria bacterium]